MRLITAKTELLLLIVKTFGSINSMIINLTESLFEIQIWKFSASYNSVYVQ